MVLSGRPMDADERVTVDIGVNIVVSNYPFQDTVCDFRGTTAG